MGKRPYVIGPPLTVCAHCRDPIPTGAAIAWHSHTFHFECAKKLLIVAQMTKDELTAAVEGALLGRAS